MKDNVQLLILEALDGVCPSILPFKTLLAQVNMKAHEAVVPSQLKRELQELVPMEATEIDDRDKGLVYAITARGRARLANA